jgi:predicted Ser/Thr protein kinase
MAQFFNNKNLNFLGKGKGGGEVLTNGTYAYKFVKTADIDALKRELRFTLKAAKIGVAPHIYDSEIKQVPDGEWVMRIRMKKLKGNLEDYARNVVGGKVAVRELSDIMTDLNEQGRICHNDISNPGNIMHDGERLYIIDYSEATDRPKNSKCEKDFLMFEKISRDPKWKKILEPASNSPAKTFRVLKLNNRSPSGSPRSPNGTPRTPRSPNGTPRTPRSPNGTPRTPRSPNGTPSPKRRRTPRSPNGTPSPKRRRSPRSPKRLLL